MSVKLRWATMPGAARTTAHLIGVRLSERGVAAPVPLAARVSQKECKGQRTGKALRVPLIEDLTVEVRALPSKRLGAKPLPPVAEVAIDGVPRQLTCDETLQVGAIVRWPRSGYFEVTAVELAPLSPTKPLPEVQQGRDLDAAGLGGSALPAIGEGGGATTAAAPRPLPRRLSLASARVREIKSEFEATAQLADSMASKAAEEELQAGQRRPSKRFSLAEFERAADEKAAPVTPAQESEDAEAEAFVTVAEAEEAMKDVIIQQTANDVASAAIAFGMAEVLLCAESHTTADALLQQTGAMLYDLWSAHPAISSLPTARGADSISITQAYDLAKASALEEAGWAPLAVAEKLLQSLALAGSGRVEEHQFVRVHQALTVLRLVDDALALPVPPSDPEALATACGILQHVPEERCAAALAPLDAPWDGSTVSRLAMVQWLIALLNSVQPLDPIEADFIQFARHGRSGMLDAGVDFAPVPTSFKSLASAVVSAIFIAQGAAPRQRAALAVRPADDPPPAPPSVLQTQQCNLVSTFMLNKTRRAVTKARRRISLADARRRAEGLVSKAQQQELMLAQMSLTERQRWLRIHRPRDWADTKELERREMQRAAKEERKRARLKYRQRLLETQAFQESEALAAGHRSPRVVLMCEAWGMAHTSSMPAALVRQFEAAARDVDDDGDPVIFIAYPWGSELEDVLELTRSEIKRGHPGLLAKSFLFFLKVNEGAILTTQSTVTSKQKLKVPDGARPRGVARFWREMAGLLSSSHGGEPAAGADEELFASNWGRQVAFVTNTLLAGTRVGDELSCELSEVMVSDVSSHLAIEPRGQSAIAECFNRQRFAEASTALEKARKSARLGYDEDEMDAAEEKYKQKEMSRKAQDRIGRQALQRKRATDGVSYGHKTGTGRFVLGGGQDHKASFEGLSDPRRLSRLSSPDNTGMIRHNRTSRASLK